ncbi:hypothetical protein C7475_101264 [Chitinophaga sp. S165]|nr:hypothetical protein C7475_101264 [Chitinophaga sp. S165]
MSSYLNAKNILKDRRLAFLKVAISQIGESEYSGDKNNPTIFTYHEMGSGVDWDEGTPWCSSFVNYALLVGNLELGRTKLAASNSCT